MESSWGSSCSMDQNSENFTFEVPVTNPNEYYANEVLLIENGITENHKITTSSIVIEDIDNVNDERHKSTEDVISIVSDDEEQDIAALNEGINNEIINNNAKYFEVETTAIDLENDTNRKDSDVIILDGTKNDSASLNERNTKEKAHDVIDVEKATECSIIDVSVNHNSEVGNGILDELIEKCHNIKNSAGMPRVINRTLLVIYKDVDEKYKKSAEFKKVISDTIEQLNTEPELKFSHIKNLCSIMKQHITKRRVPFITLDKHIEHSSTTPKKRRKVHDIIDLDDDDTAGKVTSIQECAPIGKVYPPIDLDSTDEENFEYNDEISLNKENTLENSSVKSKVKKKKKFKQKIFRLCNISKLKKKLIYAPRRNQSRYPKYTKASLTKQSDLINSVTDPQMLLEPRMSVGVEISESNRAMIGKIEKKIAVLKTQLEKLEETEVLVDNYSSPYLYCEKVKSTILHLYKQLCNLTGTEVSKRHKVRLQVVAGHPEGPVRCLEDFLNENIDEDGNPPFPDMRDVMKCVINANLKYNMYWNDAQILNEAQALFTQFGQSMQKRRQKREWKDLMSLVKTEIVDPADEDPVLHARLEENKFIAKQKELDILDRYAKLEQRSDPELRLNINESESDEDTDEDSHTNTVEQLKITNITSNAEVSIPPAHFLGNVDEDTVVNCSENIDIRAALNNENTCESQVPNQHTNFVSEFSKFITNMDQNSRKTLLVPENPTVEATKRSELDLEVAARIAKDIITLVQSGSNTDLNDKPNQHNASFNPVVRLTNLNNLSKYNVATTSVPSVLSQNKLDTSEDVANVSKEDSEIKVEDGVSKVKPEPLDIPSMLDELGEGYTATIFDIEDPFLVIEISDSSESEDEDYEHFNL